MSWETEFGNEYAVPSEIEALVSAKELVDESWHNDVCPSFGPAAEYEDDLRIWVDHPDQNLREMGQEERFLVRLDREDDDGETLFFTNDINEAISKFRELLPQVS